MTRLKGITWDHPRGYAGLKVATRAFTTLFPDLIVDWDIHSLHHFESHPVPDLAAKYDLMVIDHPSMGEAVAHESLVNLEEYGALLGLEELAEDSVGLSFESYRYQGGLWALPLDAAAQVAAFRPDLLTSGIPRSLSEVRALVRSIPKGSIAIAYKGVHSLMVFFTLCANLGEGPFSDPDVVVSDATGTAALDTMLEILSWCPKEVLEWNSIAVLDAMSARDDLFYCPYVYGFSPYSKVAGEDGVSSSASDRRRLLAFADIPGVEQADCKGSVIGGTGLAISSRSKHRSAALELAAFLLSRSVQKGMALHDGQPGRRSAWVDKDVNERYHDFFQSTLTTLERAYLRPRYSGYIRFQFEAGQMIEAFLRRRLEGTSGTWKDDALGLLRTLRELHRQRAAQTA